MKIKIKMFIRENIANLIECVVLEFPGSKTSKVPKESTAPTETCYSPATSIM
jgi:hypothetical protein